MLYALEVFLIIRLMLDLTAKTQSARFFLLHAKNLTYQKIAIDALLYVLKGCLIQMLSTHQQKFVLSQYL